MNTWDKRYLQLARVISSWSRDPSTKVGAVLVNEANEIIATGFNGLPRGVEDTPNRLHNRDIKLAMTIHAEKNAILFAKGRTEGCTIYVYGMEPCSQCAAFIVQSGIVRVVATTKQSVSWATSMAFAKEMFAEAHVVTDYYDPGVIDAQ